MRRKVEILQGTAWRATRRDAGGGGGWGHDSKIRNGKLISAGELLRKGGKLAANLLTLQHGGAIALD